MKNKITSDPVFAFVDIGTTGSVRKRYRSQNRQPFVATAPNQVWTYDFVFDGCANGQKLKCLTVVDAFSKESQFIDVRCRVIKKLEKHKKNAGQSDTLNTAITGVNA